MHTGSWKTKTGSTKMVSRVQYLAVGGCSQSRAPESSGGPFAQYIRSGPEGTRGVLSFGACTFCTHLFSLTLLGSHPSVLCLCGISVYYLVDLCMFTGLGGRRVPPRKTLQKTWFFSHRCFKGLFFICTSFFDDCSKVFPYIFHPFFEIYFCMFFYTCFRSVLIFIF